MLVKWLLLGKVGSDILESTIGYDEKALEDIILVVSSTGASVFYSAEAAPFVQVHHLPINHEIS